MAEELQVEEPMVVFHGWFRVSLLGLIPPPPLVKHEWIVEQRGRRRMADPRR